MSSEDYKTTLNTNPSADDMSSIESPQIKLIIATIKQIQKRLKDDDIRNLEYNRVYHQLSNEFNSFFEKYTSLFIKVIRGEDLKTVASILFYKDKVLTGKITENQVTQMLANKYLPENIRDDVNKKLAEMEQARQAQQDQPTQQATNISE